MKTFISNLFVVLSLISLPNPIFGQAPALGTASDFAVFTAIGAFGNSGTSSITGDVGTQAGEFSGFPPGTLVGNIHVADTVSYQVSLDVNTAYNNMAEITCGIVLGTTLGNNQTLTPDVYCLGAASVLNGNLTLDGNGDSNALFILKINGALTTNSLSKVILINSVLASNVYWSINGEFVAGDSSLFKGTLLVNGAISFLDYSSLEGRALSRQGAITLSNNLIEIKTPLVNVLPVTLISFEAQTNKANTGTVLTWKTASELNSAYFLIERSFNGVDYQSIGKMQAAGSSNQLNIYSFADNAPNEGVNYYRLNQFDFNGVHNYSMIKAVYFEKSTASATIVPVPFSSSINVIMIDAVENNTLKLQIFDVTGKEVLSATINKVQTDINTDYLPSGIYFYTIIGNNRIIKSGKLVAR